jgi:hypothetical protein
MTEQERTQLEYENFRMYHQLQYDRIDKHESKRETFSNLVLTLSAGLYLIGLGDVEKLNDFNSFYVSLIVIFVNIAAIIFASKSRYWIKLHQQRAEAARIEFAPKLEEWNETAFENYQRKLDSNRKEQWWEKMFQRKEISEDQKSKTAVKNESDDKPTPNTEILIKNNELYVNNNGKPTKKGSNKDWLRREKIYQYLHLAVIAISIFSIYSFVKLKNTPRENNHIKIEISKLPKVSVDLGDTINVNSYPIVRDSN